MEEGAEVGYQDLSVDRLGGDNEMYYSRSQ